MDDTELKNIASDLIKDVDFSKIFDDESQDEGQVNFWIPLEYKEKYQQIQKASGKTFSKLIKAVIMKCIDQAAPYKKAA